MLREQDVPRTVSLIVLSVLTLVACFLNAFAQIEWFATAAGVTGFAFGGIQGIVPALASEIFGLLNLATNYSMLQVGPAFCEYSLTAPRLHDQESLLHVSSYPLQLLSTSRDGMSQKMYSRLIYMQGVETGAISCSYFALSAFCICRQLPAGNISGWHALREGLAAAWRPCDLQGHRLLPSSLPD